MDAREEVVERGGVPPPVHVGLAGAKRSVRENALVDAIIVDLHVPGTVAVDTDVDVGENSGDWARRRRKRRCHSGQFACALIAMSSHGLIAFRWNSLGNHKVTWRAELRQPGTSPV